MSTELAHRSLVALTPQEMGPAQADLASWLNEKIKALEQESKELDEHMLIARANGWKLTSLTANINRTARRITYYDKVKQAVEAGYLVVPNFPVTLMAVRVDREKQPEKTASWRSSVSRAEPQLLPAGQGRYVDEALFTHDHTSKIPDGKGGERTESLYASGDYDEPDFPFAMVKPVVLDATQRAMALKVFDTIGVVRNDSGRDPIMVGQILDPRGRNRCVTFFIAWWLDTRSL